MFEAALFLSGVAAGIILTLVFVRRGRSLPAGWRSAIAQQRARDEAEERRRVVEEALEALSAGVVVFDDTMQPVVMNAGARVLLGSADPAGPPTVPSAILSVARRVTVSGAEEGEVVELWNPVRTSVEVRAVPIAGGIVLGLRDVSAEQAVARTRRQFVAHASHELKTPVASIQTLGEALLRATKDDPQAVARFAQRLVGETERLGSLVEDLLDLSRLEDPASYADGDVDLSEVAREKARELEATAQIKGISYSADVAPGIHVRGDARQIGLMTRNLLDNAVRYTESGGRVHLSVATSGAEAVISVRDTGIGIPLNAQGRVFERFFRVDEGRAREHGGTGLGLAIVKHVADAHGGRVELDSEYGEGSTFSVRLPLASSSSRIEASA